MTNKRIQKLFIIGIYFFSSPDELSIFSNGSHLEWRAGLSDTILKGTHPMTIPARFGLIWFDKRITFKSSSLKPLNQIKPILAGIVLEWRAGLSDTILKGDHPSQILVNLVQRLQRRRFKCDPLSKYA
jgi:hypothetical protein